MGAWVISFFLPAARIDIGKSGGGSPSPGWEIAYHALVLFFVPVKGAWLGVLPSLWTVFLNVFMLLVPWQMKRMEKGEGRVFAMLFSIATAFPVVLAYFPPSLGVAGLAFPLLVGFYVWEFAMLVAAVQFMRTLWGDNWGYTPATVLTVLLLFIPIRRGDWKFVPAQPDSATVAAPRSLPETDPEKIQSTDVKLESSTNPSLGGERVTFSMRVSVPRGPLPGGSVSIMDGKTILYQAHTDSDATSFSTDALSIGEHWIHATFTPDTYGLYLSGGETVCQIVNDPKDRKTRTLLSVKEQHPGRAGTIWFTLSAKVTTEEKGTTATPGVVILTSSGGWNIPLQLDEKGEATLSSSIAGDRWRGYELRALYIGGKGFQASRSRLTLE